MIILKDDGVRLSYFGSYTTYLPLTAYITYYYPYHLGQTKII